MAKNCDATILSIITVIFIVGCFFLLTWILVNQIKDHYSQYDPKLLEIKENLSKYFPDLLSKVTLHEGDSSYTLNKTKIYMCLFDENGKYYNDNTLYHVILHELAHVKSHDIGHTALFHKNFQELLEQAEKYGLYDPNISIPENYSKHPKACKK